MLAALVVVLRSLALIFSGHRAVALENLALRQQLAVFRRTVPRPHSAIEIDCFGSARPCLAGLAHCADRRAAGHRRTLASAMAPPPVDPTLYAYSSWLAQYQCRHSDARRANGRRESPLGRASNPRRIGQARYRRLGADRLAALTAAPSSAVTDMAYLPDESSDIPGVAGLLHRTDGHRTRAVRARAAVPSPSAYRPSPDHGASHGGVDDPAGRRALSPVRTARGLTRLPTHGRSPIAVTHLRVAPGRCYAGAI